MSQQTPWLALLIALLAVPAAGRAEESTSALDPAATEQTRSVTRARFTTAVIDREPQDHVRVLGNEARGVAFFSELRGFSGETVFHRWTFAGEVVAEVPFRVHGDRWRVYSTKRLDPQTVGEWSVAVVDAEGRVLAESRLAYVDSTGEAALPASADEPRAKR